MSDKILIISFRSILNPVTFSNNKVSNFIKLFFIFSVFLISNLLASPPHISLIN